MTTSRTQPEPRLVEPLTLTHEVALGGGWTIHAAGEIDAASAGSFRDVLRDAVDSGANDVAVEMSRVSFMDSAGLSALIFGYKKCDGTPTRFHVADPSGPVTHLFKITGQFERFCSSPAA